jgi:acetyl-CoA carboxylase biotin carboxylase subunit
MNTRLQVEHGVTEETTGLDLVAAQVRSAGGEPLSAILPATVARSGWAIEARVYAEDPKRFLPSPGHLKHFAPPRMDAIRIETGYAQGMDVTPHYDPLLAKVIAHAATRDQAIARLLEALGEFAIEGLRHNIPALRAILCSDEFGRGDVHTGLAMQVVGRPH